jgi:ABC-type lipoprotein release transport system permease subunit
MFPMGWNGGACAMAATQGSIQIIFRILYWLAVYHGLTARRFPRRALAASQRTQECGIRLALGARSWDVLWLILAEGIRLAFAGVVLGVAATLALTRLLASLLFGVELATSWLPALRATRVSPTAILRFE